MRFLGEQNTVREKKNSAAKAKSKNSITFSLMNMCSVNSVLDTNEVLSKLYSYRPLFRPREPPGEQQEKCFTPVAVRAIELFCLLVKFIGCDVQCLCSPWG